MRASLDPRSPATAPLVLRFDDNALLSQLYGEYDHNLIRIEQEIGVHVNSRGNEVAITGPSDQVGIARDVLTGLYDQLKRGLPVDRGEVDGVIRMACEAYQAGLEPDIATPEIVKTPRRHIQARSLTQAAYLRAQRESELVIGTGPAGTGKTYLAVAIAASMLASGMIDRIILSRPAVEAGERLGFLPGDLKEKVDPYLRPLYDALHDMMPADAVAKGLETEQIEIAPLAFMRGRTLSNAFVILDEAQNTTPVQMKMFLTRLGENSRMVVTGDLSQIDLPPHTASGLKAAINVLDGVSGVRLVRFSDVDVVRNPLVTRIVQAYAAADARTSSEEGGQA